MFAYSAYKKYKENKDKKSSSQLPLDRKPSDASGTPLHSTTVSIEEAPVPRAETQISYAEVTDKREQRKQWIALGISLFVDVVCPIILYVSFHSTRVPFW
jgi:hypothetical protein